MSTLDLEEANVQSIQYVKKNNQHYYLLTLVSRGSFCPECNTFSRKIHDYKDKMINHSILLKEKLTVVYHQRRYKCPDCSRTFVESDPFTFHHCRFSNKTADNVLNLLKDYNQTFSSASRLTGISVTEVIEIFDEYVQIDRKRLQEIICIDEFYFS